MLTKLYVALGDSISIDKYPALETGIQNIGAASLFAKHLNPSVFQNLAEDGATTEDVLRKQLPLVNETTEPAVVTITAGGNDILIEPYSALPATDLVKRMKENLVLIVETVYQKLPNARILLGTVYDPTENMDTMKQEREWLIEYNAFVRRLASRENLRLADIHAHFIGHREWYWKKSIVEPNAEGAREISSLWKKAFERI